VSKNIAEICELMGRRSLKVEENKKVEVMWGLIIPYLVLFYRLAF
jgi:hypothetical protein